MFEDYSFAKECRERPKAIIPQDKESRIFLGDIDYETKRTVESRFDPCPIINYDWYCNTIAYLTVEGFIKALNTDMHDSNARNAYINFYDLFAIKVTTKVNEDAEKEGNINIAFIPGPTAVKLISAESINDTIPSETTSFMDFFKIEIPGEDEEIVRSINEKYTQIDRYIRYALSNNYAIGLSDRATFMSFGVCYYFILNIFRKLLRDLGEHPDQNQVSVNFNDLIEFHASKNEDDEVVLLMRPGLNAKILIKSDETTEDDEYEDAMY